VRGLADRLQRNGVSTSLDQWDVLAGMDVTSYMETRIRESDFVVLICTPTFAKKADSNKGGVGYEKAIVTGEVFQGTASDKKFIPVLRAGNPARSLPSYLKSRAYIDFRDNSQFESSFEMLLRHVFASPKYPRPEIGTPPFLPALTESLSGTDSEDHGRSRPHVHPTQGRAASRPGATAESPPKSRRVVYRRTEQKYEKNVFLNCPFDEAYRPLFDALVFTVLSCGLVPRSALEIDSEGYSRFQKIFTLISECKFGIHDLTRTELDPLSKLPRMNVSFELGVFMGAQRFDQSAQRSRAALILDRDAYRYRSVLSDISGQDIHSHKGSAKNLIAIVRNWLAVTSHATSLPSGTQVYDRYRRFRKDLPGMLETLRIDAGDLPYAEYVQIAVAWTEKVDR
jgi:hypothetical protein